MLSSLLILGFTTVNMGSATIDINIKQIMNVENSPGLSCQRIGLAMVYDNPSLSSKILGRTQDFIAVTGNKLNGFYPIITGSKIRGWVMANQTYQGKSFDARPCKVQVQPDGKLLFEQP